MDATLLEPETLEAIPATPSSGDPVSFARPLSRRERGAAIGLVVAVVLLVLLGIAWNIAAAASRSAVTVSMDAKPITCSDVTPSIVRDQGVFQYDIPLEKSFSCDVRVHIHNAGAFPVTISQARYTWLGPDSVTAHATSVDSLPSRADPDNPDDAIGHLQNPVLAPGESYSLVAHVERAKVTCYQGVGSGAGFVGSPILTVSSLGISGERSSGSVRFGFSGTATSFDAACNDGN